MNISTVIITLLVLCLSSNLNGQNQSTKHPIDQAFEECIKNGDGQIECLSLTIEGWDQELNRQYKLLMDTLPISLQQRLRDTQRAWIKFKDEEMMLFVEMDEQRAYLTGPVGRAVSYHKYDLIKQRALELHDYYINWISMNEK